MINQKVLDSVKLVDGENIASDLRTEQAIDRAVAQGSQAWGVTMEDAVVLRLTKELQESQGQSSEVQELSNKLKGLQMEGGRLRKQIAVLEGLVVLSNQQVEELETRLNADA